MPFTWQITIQTNAPAAGYSYNPTPLTNVVVADQIIWTNTDTKPHWPALKNSDGTLNKTYFMANQIAPNSPSMAFVPGVKGAFTYVDSLDPTGPTGQIVIS